MKTLVADIEANGLLRASLRGSALTHIWCIAIGDVEGGPVILYADQPGCRPLAEGLQRLREADRVVMHNGLQYDIHAIEQFFPGTLRWDQVIDTLVLSRLDDPSRKGHSLEEWGHRLGLPKIEHEDWSCWSPEMGKRCVGDVELTRRVYHKISDRVRNMHGQEPIDLEHQVAWIISLQINHGFRLNVPEAQNLESDLRQEMVDLVGELQDIFRPVLVPTKGSWDFSQRTWINVEVTTPKVGKINGKSPYVKDCPYSKIKPEIFNPGSGDQIAWRMSSLHGWKPTKFTPTGKPQVDTAVVAEMTYNEAEALKRYMRVEKMLGQLADGDNAWLKAVSPEGYVYGGVNTIGCRTHRMSHFSPNMGQVDKKELRMRAVWLPDEGHKLGGTDAEGLELRMLGHYLARYDDGAFWQAVVSGRKDLGTDNHTLAQKAIGFYSRDETKRAVYAYMYGAGDQKLGSIAFDDADLAGKPRPPGSATAVGKRVRASLEAGIPGLGTLIKLVKGRHTGKSKNDKVYLRSLDGRQVLSVSAHSALNTLLQTAGAIVMKKALAIFHFELCREAGYVDDRGYTVNFNYCANVHDEVQKSAPDGHIQILCGLFAKAITLAGERLGVRCPLSGSFDIGNNWKETH